MQLAAKQAILKFCVFIGLINLLALKLLELKYNLSNIINSTILNIKIPSINKTRTLIAITIITGKLSIFVKIAYSKVKFN